MRSWKTSVENKKHSGQLGLSPVSEKFKKFKFFDKNWPKKKQNLSQNSY